nr:TPA_asm: PolB-C [Rhodactis coral adintovirus]
MLLKALPKTFGLTELKKGYLPHFFNRLKNQDYIGPIPPIEDYDPDSMSKKERNEFLTWHQELQNRNYVFDFHKELIEYCRSDVDILRRCCLKFKELMQETCDLDPFLHCVTIASACNRVFRQQFLQEQTIGLIPPHGYQPARKYSVLALQWLSWVHHQTGNRILHALNGGEQRINGNYVDGYDPERRVIYEFMGCLWHGCEKCYLPETINPVNDTSMADLREETTRKTERFKQLGYTVEVMWECEFRQQLQSNAELAEFVKQLTFDAPLEPRDAFFGGRTNAVCLYKDVSQEEKIHYVDFTSLYPWTNKYGTYPIGHPEILTSEALGNRTADEFYGLIKCDILPPSFLFHPVLPYRAQGKLMFPLCRTCAENLQQTPCEHTDEERMLSGTWCSIEIEKARELGYRVIRMIEVWHFPEESSDLFTQYIDTFLKIKQEASGWPSWCGTQEQKEQYIQEYQDKEGISLDPEKVKKNPGLRSLAKLMLNSFWGKFGQQENMPQVELVKDPERYFRLLTCQSTQVKHIQFVNDECIEMHYTHGDGFVAPSDKTNVVIAAFTTTQARLKLYSVLERLQRRVLYFDTDSVIFTSKPGEWVPPLGDYLGELTNELDDDDYITTFVSGGPKNYAYQTKNGKTTCKVRGFTLNYRGSQKLNFSAMCAQVCNPSEEPIFLENPHFIKRNSKDKTLETVSLTKKYKLVYDKRVVQGFNTYPYGYH